MPCYEHLTVGTVLACEALCCWLVKQALPSLQTRWCPAQQVQLQGLKKQGDTLQPCYRRRPASHQPQQHTYSNTGTKALLAPCRQLARVGPMLPELPASGMILPNSITTAVPSVLTSGLRNRQIHS